MATVTEAPPAAEPVHRPYTVTSDGFFQMIEAEVFPRERRVYLWDGRLCEAMAKTVAHAGISVAFHGALSRRLPHGWLLWPENPINLDSTHAPLPDLSVVDADSPFAFIDLRRHPGPGDVGLIIEIAETSLPRDLGERCEQYARALVPVYWVADVSGRRIVIHEGPRVVAGHGEYERVLVCEPGKTLQLSLRGQAIDPIPYEEVMR